MGEIAEMMLNGTMCAMCGVFLDDEFHDQGFPGYCSRECAADAGVVPETPKHTSPFFAVRNAKDLENKLPAFLKSIDYTYSSHEVESDKKGNPLIRLYYDKYPNKDHAWGVEKRGIVVCPNKTLVPDVQRIIKQYERPEI